MHIHLTAATVNPTHAFTPSRSRPPFGDGDYQGRYLDGSFSYHAEISLVQLDWRQVLRVALQDPTLS